MELEDFQSAEVLQADIDTITAIQAKHALTGARVNVRVTNAAGDQELVSTKDLKTILGDTAYNTICSTALTSLNTALASAKTTKQTAFDDLGT